MSADERLDESAEEDLRDDASSHDNANEDSETDRSQVDDEEEEAEAAAPQTNTATTGSRKIPAVAAAAIALADPRFEERLPNPIEEVETLELALPGHDYPTDARQTVHVTLSAPRRRFERKFRVQLAEMRKAAILRRLEGDEAATAAFLAQERERERETRARAERRARRGSGEDDGDDVMHGAGKHSDDNSDEEMDSDTDDDSNAEGVDGSGPGTLVPVDEDPTATPAQRAREERLRRRRHYPYWLPALLANDVAHFERTCAAMYGWAIAPLLPAARHKKNCRNNGSSNSGRGLKQRGAGRGYVRSGSRQTVSFRATRGEEGDDENEDEEDEDETEARRTGRGRRSGGARNGENDDEDEDLSTMADPARKTSSFFFRSGAFSGDGDSDSSRAALAAGNEDIHATTGAIGGQGEHRSGSNERSSPRHATNAAAVSGTDAEPQEACRRGASTTTTTAPLSSLPAFPEANYPFYIAWETTRGHWHLLDVHPEVYELRELQAARAAREKRQKRRVRHAKKRGGGRRGTDDDSREATDDEDDVDDSENGGPGVGSEDGDGAESGSGSDQDAGDDREGTDTAVRQNKGGNDEDAALHFDTSSMKVVDALMLAALRSPAALRIMLLQNPEGAKVGAAAVGVDGSSSSGDGGSDSARAEYADEEAAGAAGTRSDEYSSGIAAGERILSLRCLEDWMRVDLTSGFPILSAIYTILLAARVVDAPRLPYTLTSHLPLDVNVFFTDSYVFSHPGALQLIGAEQNTDRNPISKRLDSIASPRSGTALRLLRSLLRAGIVPRLPIATARLTTPESVQLALWLLMVVPRGLLEGWGREAKARLVREYERIAHGRGSGGSNTTRAADGTSVDGEEEDADADDDGLAADDGVDYNDMTEDAVVRRVVIAARRADRERVRANRRVVKLLKKRFPNISLTAPRADDVGADPTVLVVAATSSNPANHDGVAAASIDLRPFYVALHAHSNRRGSGDDDDTNDSSAVISGSNNSKPTPAQRHEAAWRALTDAAAAWLGSAVPTRPFLPGPMLLQTALEVRRRIALERAGKGTSRYRLSFVLEEPLAAIVSVLGNGKITGDELVTAAFHTQLPHFAAASSATTPGEASLTPRVPADAAVQSAVMTDDSHHNRINKSSSHCGVRGETQNDANRSATFLANRTRTDSVGLLPRAQCLYQSDLVLLLLALTTTADPPAILADTRTNASPGDLVDGDMAATHSDVTTAAAAAQQQQSVRRTCGTSVAKTQSRATTVSLTGELNPPATISAPGTDAHQEVFQTLLHAKLRGAGGAVRAGKAAPSLLSKLRSGTLRLLFSALQRFAVPATIQILCDAAPLFELLGPNERCPLLDIALTWAAEQDVLRGGRPDATSGPAANFTNSSQRLACCSSSSLILTRAASRIMSNNNNNNNNNSTHQHQHRHSGHQPNSGDGPYLRLFANTFWSEISYRFEAGLLDAGTRELLRARLPALLDRVTECSEAYSRAVATLASGSRLRHTAIARGVATFAAAYGRPEQLVAFAEAFPIPGAPTRPHGKAAMLTGTTPSAAATAPDASGRSAAKEGVAAPPQSQLQQHEQQARQPNALLPILSPHSAEYCQDEERVRALLEALPMAPRTIYTPELLHTVLFAAEEMDAVAARMLMVNHGVVTVREGGPFPIYTRRADNATAATSTATTDMVPVGCELPALEYALRTGNARAARLLVLLGLPLSEPAFDGACTLETLAERCLSSDEVTALRLLSLRRRQAMAVDPECLYGGVRAN